VKHRATTRFWRSYRELPEQVQHLADKCYERLRQNPRHPSLHLKRTGRFWSVRIGLRHRALGVEDDDTVAWFWIGTHAQYDRLLERR